MDAHFEQRFLDESVPASVASLLFGNVVSAVNACVDSSHNTPIFTSLNPISCRHHVEFADDPNQQSTSNLQHQAVAEEQSGQVSTFFLISYSDLG